MTKYVKIMCIFIYVFFALSGLWVRPRPLLSRLFNFIF